MANQSRATSVIDDHNSGRLIGLSKSEILTTLLLLLATPFLLFPSIIPIGTAVALGLIVLMVILQKPLALTRVHYPLILFSLMIIVGILVSADREATLPKSTGLILGLATFYQLQRVLRTPKRLVWGIYLYILMGLGFMVIGFFTVDWTQKVPFLSVFILFLPNQVASIPGATDGGVQANQLAATLLLFWPLLLAVSLVCFSRRSWKISNAVCLGMIIASFLTTLILIFTQSRSAWLAALASVMVMVSLWGWLSLPIEYQSLVFAAWIAMFVGFGILVSVIGIDRLAESLLYSTEQTVIGNLSSFRFRIELWHWALESLKRFPFTGTGLGTFRHVVWRFFPLQVPRDYDIAHAHNIFLQVALDVGLPGLISYLSLLIGVAGAGLKVAWKDVFWRPYAIGLLAGVLALHIFGLTDTLALGSKPGLLFWMGIGLLLAMSRISMVSKTN